MNIFMVAASLRSGSLNKKLSQTCETLLTTEGVQVDNVDFRQFNMPLYDGDIQDKSGIPTEAQNFADKMLKADGTIIVSPEYNFSTPGILKNLIDWVSRIQPMPFNGQCLMVMSASPSLVGGNRGIFATKVPLEGCGACVHPS